MLTDPSTLRLFGAPRAVPSKKSPRFRMETRLKVMNSQKIRGWLSKRFDIKGVVIFQVRGNTCVMQSA